MGAWSGALLSTLGLWKFGALYALEMAFNMCIFRLDRFEEFSLTDEFIVANDPHYTWGNKPFRYQGVVQPSFDRTSCAARRAVLETPFRLFTRADTATFGG